MYRWKFLLWYRSKLPVDYNALNAALDAGIGSGLAQAGGGVSGPNIFAGAFRALGDFKIFEDASTRYAWSLFFYEPFAWTLRGPSASVPLGVKLSYDFPFVSAQAWTAAADAYNAKTPLRAGASLSVTGVDAYRPTLLYRYAVRGSSSLFEKNASWYREESSALQVHSVGLAQEFSFPTPFVQAFIKAAAAASVTDTEPAGGSGSLFVDLNSHFVSLSLYAQGASPRYALDDMGYQRDLWSHSAQLRVKYAPYSFVQARYAFAKKNPAANPASSPAENFGAAQGRADEDISQHYALRWSHRAEAGFFAHEFSAEYEIFSGPLRHRARVEYDFFAGEFRLSAHAAGEAQQAARMLFDAPRASLSRARMQAGVAAYLREVLPSLTVVLKSTVFFTLYSARGGEAGFEKIDVRAGISARASGASISVEVPFSYEEEKGAAMSLDFSLQYDLR